MRSTLPSCRFINLVTQSAPASDAQSPAAESSSESLSS
eukprot:CAMPEP_0174941436 /NCGR_PEP_ID=MMETSP1355-20121228/71722_1 /TAXON_ID=464990 /ORGANISM="Hemiselmis tepida, Strain CCMP443" /LENGTH=37 /DNA_ID= /DNA_START= /DNA_END= /DNA_ORIENTATION=